MENGSKDARLITRVVVYYRRPGEAEEHQLTLESTQGGGAIDGVSWNTPLVEKLVYRENGRYVDPRRGRDPGNWKVSTTTREMQLTDDPDGCVWVHLQDCNWDLCCTDGL